jgi:hypothetical protein
MAIAMTDEIDNIVKPELQDQWEEAKWSWFVRDHTDPYQTRLPGLMKEEWRTSNGAMIA